MPPPPPPPPSQALPIHGNSYRFAASLPLAAPKHLAWSRADSFCFDAAKNNGQMINAEIARVEAMDNSTLNSAVLSAANCEALHALALQHLRPQSGSACGMNLVNCATLLHRLAKMGNSVDGGASCLQFAISHASKLLSPAAIARTLPAPRTL